MAHFGRRLTRAAKAPDWESPPTAGALRFDPGVRTAGEIVGVPAPIAAAAAEPTGIQPAGADGEQSHVAA